MGKRTFKTLFKQLTVIFQSLTCWQQHQPQGTGSVEAGSVEEAHPSPSPSHLTPYNTCPFPYLHDVHGHRDNPLCKHVPLQIPVGTDGAMVCHSCVPHASVPSVRRVERGNSRYFLPLLRHSKYSCVGKICLLPYFALDEVPVGFTLVLCKYLHKSHFLGEKKRDFVGDGRISQDKFHL